MNYIDKMNYYIIFSLSFTIFILFFRILNAKNIDECNIDFFPKITIFSSMILFILNISFFLKKYLNIYHLFPIVILAYSFSLYHFILIFRLSECNIESRIFNGFLSILAILSFTGILGMLIASFGYCIFLSSQYFYKLVKNNLKFSIFSFSLLWFGLSMFLLKYYEASILVIIITVIQIIIFFLYGIFKYVGFEKSYIIAVIGLLINVTCFIVEKNLYDFIQPQTYNELIFFVIIVIELIGRRNVDFVEMDNYKKIEIFLCGICVIKWYTK